MGEIHVDPLTHRNESHVINKYFRYADVCVNDFVNPRPGSLLLLCSHEVCCWYVPAALLIGVIAAC
jgi:hypothetical protein